MLLCSLSQQFTTIEIHENHKQKQGDTKQKTHTSPNVAASGSFLFPFLPPFLPDFFFLLLLAALHFTLDELSCFTLVGRFRTTYVDILIGTSFKYCQYKSK